MKTTKIAPLLRSPYDADAVEFTLCVEHTSGAFATYDTAPMATGEQGEGGGCPAL